MDPKDRWTSFASGDSDVLRGRLNQRIAADEQPNWQSDPSAGDKAIEKSDDAWRMGKDKREGDFRQKIEDEAKTLQQNLKAGIEKYFEEYPSSKAMGAYSIIGDISIPATTVTEYPDDRVKKEIKIQKADKALKHLEMLHKRAKKPFEPEKFVEDLVTGKLGEGRKMRMTVSELRGLIRECIVKSSMSTSPVIRKRRW